MPVINMTISEQILLEKCRELEMLCKELYNYFAELHSDNEEAVHLWRKTAAEEQNHADQFTLMLKLRKGIACLVSVDSSKLDSILSQMRIVLANVKAHPPTFQDALNSSIKLEKFLAEFHLGCVVEFEDSSYKKLFNAMMSSDQEHIASMQAVYDKLNGIQGWTFKK